MLENVLNNFENEMEFFLFKRGSLSSARVYEDYPMLHGKLFVLRLLINYDGSVLFAL